MMTLLGGLIGKKNVAKLTTSITNEIIYENILDPGFSLM
jgi:hypothetical protein